MVLKANNLHYFPYHNVILVLLPYFLSAIIICSALKGLYSKTDSGKCQSEFALSHEMLETLSLYFSQFAIKW